MKKTLHTWKWFGLVLCLGASPMFPVITGCAGDHDRQSAGETADDSGISLRVKSALANDALYNYDNVSVETSGGTVKLSGLVDSAGQKTRAASVAQGVEGVKGVENNITIKNRPPAINP